MNLAGHRFRRFRPYFVAGANASSHWTLRPRMDPHAVDDSTFTGAAHRTVNMDRDYGISVSFTTLRLTLASATDLYYSDFNAGTCPVSRRSVKGDKNGASEP